MTKTKILSIEDVYGNQYEFTLILDADTWKNHEQLLRIAQEQLLEKMQINNDITEINVLDIN